MKRLFMDKQHNKKMETTEKKKGAGVGKIVLKIIIGLLLLGSIATAVYFYMGYKHLKENPQAAGQDEIAAVTNVIGKFMDLPEGEDPNMATILDKEKVKDQDFFKRAENGDKILIYVKAKKAILYRPSTKRVIEVAPLVIGEQAQVQPQEGENQPQPTE